MTSPASPTHWSLPFFRPHDKDEDGAPGSRTALIILNQPFSRSLLCRLWNASDWHCCADGGANRLHDLLRLLSAEGGGGGGGASAAAATVATVATTSTSTTTTATTATTTTTAAAATATPADWLSDRIVPPQRATTSEIDDYLPDLIKGDLDSVRDDVRRYYEARVSFEFGDPFRSCVKRSLILLKF
jgi:thiamine pyrophosphokinase